MPDISITITVTDIEQDMIARRAAQQGKTVPEVAGGLLLANIRQRFNAELESALDELRSGSVTVETQTLLKNYIDDKAI